MQELKELATIVTSRGQKNSPLLNFGEKRRSKEMQLYICIWEGKCTTDEEAASIMYNTTPDDVRYKMVKSRLKRRLLNHLFFLDFSDKRFKTWYRDEQECLNLLHQARTLMKVDELSAAEKLSYKALNIATDLELTQNIVNCLELQLTIFAHHGKFSQFTKAQQKLVQYQKILQCEWEVEQHYLTARLEFNKSIHMRKDFFPKLQPVIDRLLTLWQQTRSFNIYNRYYMLNVMYNEQMGNFESIVQLAEESENLLKENKINQKRFEHRFNKFINVYAHLRTKRYQKGLDLAGKYIEAFDPSSVDWFVYMENYLLLAIHSREYDQAIQLFSKVIKNPAFKKINRLAKERWTLYQTYLYTVSPSTKVMEDFTYQEFIASVPEYSKDKQGFNVAILILQFLFFLKKQDIEALLHRIEALRKYAGTHLRDNFSHRTRTMFRLLMLVVKEDLNPKQCRIKGKYLYEKLPSIPPPGDAFAEIEIIPYEHIWEIILDILSEHKKLQLA